MKMIQHLINIFKHVFSPPTTQKHVAGKEYVLLKAFPGRRPIAEAYKLGENWYSHERVASSDWRVRLLPNGKVDPSNRLIEGWEPITPNMIKFYHSKANSKSIEGV